LSTDQNTLPVVLQNKTLEWLESLSSGVPVKESFQLRDKAVWIGLKPYEDGLNPRDREGHFPCFLSDDKARRDTMAGLVETTMTADSLQLTAHGPDEDEMRIVEDLPKAKTPHELARCVGRE
jgi:hypothetical protein